MAYSWTPLLWIPLFVFSRNRNLLKQKSLSGEEPLEPKTGTAWTVPCGNRNRTEPNRGHPAITKIHSVRPRNWTGTGTWTVRTAFSRAKSRTWTATVFQKSKPEPEPCLPLDTVLKHRGKRPFPRGTKPKTGTAWAVPCTNRNTKPKSPNFQPFLLSPFFPSNRQDKRAKRPRV